MKLTRISTLYRPKMSLYDGLSVETAPIPEISEKDEGTDASTAPSGWSADFRLMASRLQRNKKASRKVQQKPKSQLPSAVLEPQLEKKQTGVDIQSQLEGQGLLFDDLAVEIEDEYNPMIPNSYERVIRDRREEHDRIREAERKRRKEEREKEHKNRRRRRSDGSSSGSDDERSYLSTTRRKDAAAIPPPSMLAGEPTQKPEERTVVQSALEELSRKKAQKKANPFGKPKFGAIASKIMSKYGWEEGQGLGKTSQGISTALSVEKTSRRGGKIVNASAGIEEQMELDKQKVLSMAEVMKNPTKTVLLQNMVGPGEVDEDLEPETAEECTKYGEVEKCVIFEIPNGQDHEAVRIFIAFTRLEAAIKAVIDLNGRYFGGRVVSASFFPEDRFSKLDLAP